MGAVLSILRADIVVRAVVMLCATSFLFFWFLADVCGYELVFIVFTVFISAY